MQNYPRLGVNIDHVATIRNARGGTHPCPVEAAKLAAGAGAHGITAHLREDRRHIRDADIFKLKQEVNLPLNMEMAATSEMQAIALKLLPNAVCIVPEKRTEITTEGGLNVSPKLADYIKPLKAAGIRISLFIEADEKQIDMAQQVGADIIELHTGAYAHSKQGELERIVKAASYAHNLGLEVHAGHGLTFDNVAPIAAIPQIKELNIGHFLIGESIFMGLDASVKKMLGLMELAQK